MKANSCSNLKFQRTLLGYLAFFLLTLLIGNGVFKAFFIASSKPMFNLTGMSFLIAFFFAISVYKCDCNKGG